jgi:hypothetical protein
MYAPTSQGDALAGRATPRRSAQSDEPIDPQLVLTLRPAPTVPTLELNGWKLLLMVKPWEAAAAVFIKTLLPKTAFVTKPQWKFPPALFQHQA